MKTRSLLCVASVFFFVFSSQAQKSPAGADSKFVQEASAGNLAEVQLGELAKEKASSGAVKDFAGKIITDHKKANDELKSIASQEGITVATALDAKQKALYDKLSSMSGPQFDRTYMNAMIADHREDIAEFQKEAKSGQNAKVKDFAMKTLPTLEEHLRLAESTASELPKRSRNTGQ